MSTKRRVTLQPGYILHSKPYRDTSLLLEAFTRDFGRIGLVAKGARRTHRGSLKGVLQPFQALLLSWSGRGDLGTLTDAEHTTLLPPLTGHTLISGFYINELLLRLTQRHIPHPGLYLAYSHMLDVLAEGTEIEWGLRIFERDLLSELGYGLLLSHTADSGREVQSGNHYCYHLEHGPLPATDEERECFRVSGQALLSLENGSMPQAEQLKECKRLMRAALGLYLGEKPLASREMFRRQFPRNLNKEE